MLEPSLRQELLGRAARARDLANALRGLDVSDPGAWRRAVETALLAGITEQDLLERLSASRSTLHRWLAGQSAPGPHARKAIRRLMVDLADTWAGRAGPDAGDEPHAAPGA